MEGKSRPSSGMSLKLLCSIIGAGTCLLHFGKRLGLKADVSVFWAMHVCICALDSHAEAMHAMKNFGQGEGLLEYVNAIGVACTCIDSAAKSN